MNTAEYLAALSTRNLDMSYEFQSSLYRTQGEMHTAIAESYLCAGGLNGREDMQRFLAEMTDEELADDAQKNWELADNAHYDRGNLVEAIHDIRTNFNDHFPDEH
jgi:hypothetical protein